LGLGVGVGGEVTGSFVGPFVGLFVGPSVVGAFDVGAPEGFLVGIVVGFEEVGLDVGFEEVGLEDVGLGVGPCVGSGLVVGLTVGHPVIFL
jgi:hypothetical protein